MDLSLPGELDRRTWRWFCVRLFGLTLESRTWRRLLAKNRPTEEEVGLNEVDDAFGIDRE